MSLDLWSRIPDSLLLLVNLNGAKAGQRSSKYAIFLPYRDKDKVDGLQSDVFVGCHIKSTPNRESWTYAIIGAGHLARN